MTLPGIGVLVLEGHLVHVYDWRNVESEVDLESENPYEVETPWGYIMKDNICHSTVCRAMKTVH